MARLSSMEGHFTITRFPWVAPACYHTATMNHIPTLSTHLFAYQPLDESMIAAAADAGFPALEIFAAPQHFPLHDRAAALRLCREVARAGMKIQAFHAPFYSSIAELKDRQAFALGDRDSKSWQTALDSITDLVAIAAEVDSPNIVLHMGHWDPQKTDANRLRQGIETTLERNPEFSGRILLENTPRVASSPGELERATLGLNPAQSGFCLDIGHFHMSGNDNAPASFLNRIFHCHVHDNNGEKDQHLPPGEGTVDWESILAQLARIDHAPGFSLELRDPSRGTLSAEELLGQVLGRIQGPVREFLREKGVRL